MRVTVSCPGKINLFLAVGPKDAQGYHPLRTIFQAVDLCDTLVLDTDTSETRLTCSWSDLPVSNTVTKALRLVSEIVSPPPLSIHLEKRIPTQSGLGGGSSDAAGFLRGLVALGLPIPSPALKDVARAVGADVPFFLMGGRARAEGYGERLTPMEDPEDACWVTIAKPQGTACPTAEAYRRLDDVPHEWRDFPATDELHNDFELVAPQECLDLIQELRALGADGAALTGSGSAVFGIHRDESSSRSAAGRLRSAFSCDCWTVKMLDRKKSLSGGL